MAILIQNFSPSRPKNQPDTPLYKGSLGTPIYSNLNIEGGQYISNDGEIIQYQGIVIDCVLFHINQTKNIVKTPIVGADFGTVKEYIGIGDYVISCSLIHSSGQVNVHPWDLESQLQAILKAPVPIKVHSQLLQLYDIYEIVITDFDVPQLPGEYSQVNISFNALSDQPVILLYNSTGSPIQ